MRLLTKTTLYFLLMLVPLLALAGFYLFQQFNREIDLRNNRELAISEREWINFLEDQARRGNAVSFKTPDFSIYLVDEPIDEEPEITDSYEINPNTGQRILYRRLSQVVSIYGLHYQLTIKQSLQQRDVLIRKVTKTMLLVFAGIFLATIIFNWVISQKIWMPFRRSLGKIRGAELNKMETVRFEQTETVEFNELNTALNDMTSKINREYRIMKEFTENAAHEMQTPLAVVQSRLEMLMQSEGLSEDQADSINEATEALARLSKLNKGLLLIAKIENNQYESAEQVNFKQVMEKYVRLFDDLLEDKSIALRLEVSSPFVHPIHPFLADSLVSNLVGNAIKYNLPVQGEIVIRMNEESFSVVNTGKVEGIPGEQLFKRFTKIENENSNGLGLAIVKSIAEQTGLDVTYHFTNGRHEFRVSKKN